MAGITSIGNSYTHYGKFASGKQIETAADGAAELAITQKLQFRPKLTR